MSSEVLPRALEEALGYSFGNASLLVRAVTHSSLANEGPPTEAGSASADNERLEFLGDSVLGWLVSDWLFRRCPNFTEGQLSLVKNHLVSANYLLDAASRLDLGRFLHLGRGEESAGGRTKQRLLVNAFEAVLAAVYLDGGVDAAQAVVCRYVVPSDEVLHQLAGAGPPQDSRAELERMARDRGLPRPDYALIGETGPGHARVFRVEVRAGGQFSAIAEGSSKKIALHRAAAEVCRLIRGR